MVGPPTGLAIVNLDPHSVVIGWNFTTPRNVRIGELSFTLTIRNGGTQIVTKAVQGSAELRSEVKGLEKGTVYNLEIFATRSDEIISDRLSGAFTTLAEGERGFPR